ncbi:outer membrane beta-barrel protein [Kaarinaea lacus]
MKTITTAILLGSALSTTYLKAADIQIKDVNIKLEGGVSASALYFQNPGFLKRHDSYILNDAIVEILPQETNNKQFNFYAGIGVLQKQSINRINAPIPPVDIELHYGWLEVPTYKGRYIEIGQLVTKLGYESSISYKNQHVLMGAIYSAQPDMYPGIRFNGPLGTLKYYIEVTNDPTIGDASVAFGLYQQTNNDKFSISYYNAISERDMIDLVYATKLGSFDLGVNLDYHIVKDPAPNQDEKATGVAIYLNYITQKWHWPVRYEYISEGNAGIYDYENGYTLTFSPTYRFNNTQFIRVEFLTANADGKPFRNADGGFEDSQFIATLQAGLTF